MICVHKVDFIVIDFISDTVVDRLGIVFECHLKYNLRSFR